MAFDVTNPKKPTIIKDPNATLDYSEDWTAWLLDAGGDSIADHEILLTDDSTCEVVYSTVVGGIVTAFISGGTLGTKEAITYRITTANVPPRIDDRTIYLKIEAR